MSQSPVAQQGASWDEMYAPDGSVRGSWLGVASVVQLLGESGLADRRATIARQLQDDGVGYRVPGSAVEQPWSLDPLPLLIEESDWRILERGLQQRAALLDAILTDLYSTRRLLATKALPASLIYAHDGFLRAADQITLPGPRQLPLAATDLGRDPSGRWLALADRVQAPSGAGYAMENRSVLSKVLPRLYRQTEVHRIAPFFSAMRAALQQLAPQTDEPPRVVLLTPGAMSETAFDQGQLAALLGLPLVEGNDLIVQDGRVWQRSLDQLEPVHVILRRLDSAYCDPLELRPDSRLGVAGLLEAARIGSVTIVNPLGSGVLENPGLHPYLPALSELVLDEPLQLSSPPSWWCGDRAACSHVLARLRELVIKPISRGAGIKTIFGWQLDAAGRDELAARIRAEPYLWVGQAPLAMSTAPTVRGAGMEPRSIMLRTFAVADAAASPLGYRVMPGGLTRAAATANTVVVSNALGAVSKDVWVLSSTPQGAWEQAVAVDSGRSLPAALSPRVAEDLYWLGRYVERAESMARLLKVCDNRWRDLHPRPDPALARCLVVLLEGLTAVSGTWPGFTGHGAGSQLAAPQQELLALIADDGREGSLAFCLARIRRLTHAVRDQLSNDTWMVLGSLDRVLSPFMSEADPRSRPADEIPAALSRLLEALLAFSGLVSESMVRDTGWHLLDAGRRLERAVQTAGLLHACLTGSEAGPAEELLSESVLIAAESIITHRRRYPSRSGAESAVALLLGDPGNPRSITFQLHQLVADLDALPASTPAAMNVRDGLARTLARLHASDPSELCRRAGGGRADLADFLHRLTDDLLSLSGAVEAAHFGQPEPLQSLEEFAAAGDLV